MTFDLNAYLDRIALPRPDAGLAGLNALLRAHMRAIPFENLDPLRGIVPDLDLGALQRKIVTGRRGGYCFEHNLLLSAALDALGIRQRRVLGRVRLGAPEGGARSHLALLAEVDGRRVLADAGFGGPGCDAALPLDDDRPVTATGGRWRLRREGDARVLEQENGESWFPLYDFDEAEVRMADIGVANHYCATAPASPFPAHAMLGLHAENGRRGLFDTRLIVGGRGRELSDADDLMLCLARNFALSVTADEARDLWHRIAPGQRRRA